MSKSYERLLQERFNADAERIRGLEDRIARLEEVNAKLVEALEAAKVDLAHMASLLDAKYSNEAIDAALAAAKEQQPLPSPPSS